MPTSRPMRRLLPLAAILCCSLAATNAQAFFSDDEARLAINAMRKEMVTMQGQIHTLENSNKENLNLVNQLGAIQQTQAALSGRMEVLENQLTQQQKNMQTLYKDLDERLRAMDARLKKMEPQNVSLGDQVIQAVKAEKDLFDNAMAAFQAEQYQESAKGFHELLERYPATAYAPEALYWQGNAYFAMKDYKKAVEAEDLVTRKFASSPRTPDALLSLSSAQTALGNIRAAAATLGVIQQKYPGTEQAATAAQRLQELKPALAAPAKKK